MSEWGVGGECVILAQTMSMRIQCLTKIQTQQHTSSALVRLCIDKQSRPVFEGIALQLFWLTMRRLHVINMTEYQTNSTYIKGVTEDHAIIKRVHCCCFFFICQTILTLNYKVLKSLYTFQHWEYIFHFLCSILPPFLSKCIHSFN